MKFDVVLFYQYVTIADPALEKQRQSDWCSQLNLVGRILISAEGINATLSAESAQNLNDYISRMQQLFPTMAEEDFKRSVVTAADHPFPPKLVVKIVKEIVSTGGRVAQPQATEQRNYLTPQQFHAAIERKKDDTVILDVRGHKEFLAGHFQDAIDPQVKNFSEYYPFLQRQHHQLKEKHVLMYCTGGIRCEKARDFVTNLGVKSVGHLKGGIHKYLEEYPEGGFFKGKNFVFDKRVTVGPDSQDTVGRCSECHISYDTFSGLKICTVCRDLVLVCDGCMEKLNGELHCDAHQYLKNCYFTFIQYFSSDELEQQRDMLHILLEKFSTEKGWKNKRKTLRKQIAKLNVRLETIRENDSFVPELRNGFHCRTCESNKCSGNCWGFWNDKC